MSHTAQARNSFVLTQGLLKLDKPYKQPSNSDILFPFCEQYQHCSCCNASHVVAVSRTLAAQDSAPLSSGCQAMTAKLACSICDPEVGTGGKQRICANTCTQWYSQCQRDYFSYSTFLQQQVPCGTRQASAVCSTAEEFADDGQSFCQQAGYDTLSPDSPDANAECFDGSASSALQFDSCRVQPQKQHTDNFASLGRLVRPVLYVLLITASCIALIVLSRRAYLLFVQLYTNLTARKQQGAFSGKGRRLRD